METSSRPPAETCVSCGAPFAPAVAGQSLCDRCQGLLPAEPLPSPLRDSVVAGYRLVHELGAGRFSTSWVGEDPNGVAVVVKLLRSPAPDPARVQVFIAEAQRLASSRDLDHPNVAHLISGGAATAQSLFLVYESGGEQTLLDELRGRERVEIGRALELCAQLAEGLASMHNAGVLHQDLKPANVALTRLADGTQQAVLLDAATAHLSSKSGARSSGPLPLATAAYLSPEAAAGGAMDGRADLYSLGVLLYQLVSGRLPFMGATADDLLRAHREHAPPRLRDAGRKVNAELDSFLTQLLSKDPAQRFSSGDELAVVLRSLIPIADTAPVQDGPGAEDVPLPMVARVQPPRPRVEPPPAAAGVDAALERALLGEVPAQPPEKLPGVPEWMPRIRPLWWPRAAIGAAAAGALLLAALLLTRGKALAPGDPQRAVRPEAAGAPPGQAAGTARGKGAPDPGAKSAILPSSRAAPAVNATPNPGPAAGPPRSAAEPPRPAAGPSGAAAVPAGAAAASAGHTESGPGNTTPSTRGRARPSPFASQFDRAQKQLWTNKVPAAEATLQQILAQPQLARRDRARAAKMMGDAEAKRGNRPGALDWYRRAVTLYDAAADRERVARQMQSLGR